MTTADCYSPGVQLVQDNCRRLENDDARPRSRSSPDRLHNSWEVDDQRLPSDRIAMKNGVSNTYAGPQASPALKQEGANCNSSPMSATITQSLYHHHSLPSTTSQMTIDGYSTSPKVSQEPDAISRSSSGSVTPISRISAKVPRSHGRRISPLLEHTPVLCINARGEASITFKDTNGTVMGPESHVDQTCQVIPVTTTELMQAYAATSRVCYNKSPPATRPHETDQQGYFNYREERDRPHLSVNSTAQPVMLSPPSPYRGTVPPGHSAYYYDPGLSAVWAQYPHAWKGPLDIHQTQPMNIYNSMSRPLIQACQTYDQPHYSVASREMVWANGIWQYY